MEYLNKKNKGGLKGDTEVGTEEAVSSGAEVSGRRGSGDALRREQKRRAKIEREREMARRRAKMPEAEGDGEVGAEMRDVQRSAVPSPRGSPPPPVDELNFPTLGKSAGARGIEGDKGPFLAPVAPVGAGGVKRKERDSSVYSSDTDLGPMDLDRSSESELEDTRATKGKATGVPLKKKTGLATSPNVAEGDKAPQLGGTRGDGPITAVGANYTAAGANEKVEDLRREVEGLLLRLTKDGQNGAVAGLLHESMSALCRVASGLVVRNAGLEGRLTELERRAQPQPLCASPPTFASMAKGSASVAGRIETQSAVRVAGVTEARLPGSAGPAAGPSGAVNGNGNGGGSGITGEGGFTVVSRKGRGKGKGRSGGATQQVAQQPPRPKGQFKPKPLPPAVLIRPAPLTPSGDQGAVSRSGEETMRLIKGALNPVKDGIQVCRMRKNGSDGVIVETTNDSNVHKILQHPALSGAGLSVSLPPRRDPELLISGVSKSDDDEALIESIFELNRDLVQAPGLEEFKKEFALRFRTGRRDRDSTEWVASASPALHRRICKQGFLYTPWMKCRVRDYTRVTRCLRCLEFGHVAKHCKDT